MENRLAVQSENHVVIPQACRRCGRVRLHLLDHRRHGRIDHYLPQIFPAPAARRRLVRHHVKHLDLSGALDLERDGVAFAANDIPDHAVVHPGKPGHTLSVHFQNLVAGLDAGLRRRRIFFDVTNHRRHVRLAHRMADRPDDARKHQSEEQTEERPGDSDDDFIQRRNRRQLCAIDVGFALDDIHWRQLRERDKPAARDRA